MKHKKSSDPVTEMMDNHISALIEYCNNKLKDHGGYNKLSINLCNGVNENDMTVSSKIYTLGMFYTEHDEEGDIINQQFESF